MIKIVVIASSMLSLASGVCAQEKDAFVSLQVITHTCIDGSVVNEKNLCADGLPSHQLEIDLLWADNCRLPIVVKKEAIKACADKIIDAVKITRDGKVIAEIPASLLTKNEIQVLVNDVLNPYFMLNYELPNGGQKK